MLYIEAVLAGSEVLFTLEIEVAFLGGGRRFTQRNDFRNKLFTARPTAFLLAYFIQLWKLLAKIATWKLYRRAECSGASALVALHVASSIALRLALRSVRIALPNECVEIGSV